MKKIFVILLLTFSATHTHSQLFKTSLTLTVRDEVGNIVAGASVKLFEKKDDYQKETNPAAEETTSEKGVARFKDLKAITYFVLVRKGDKDNAGGGEEVKLEEGKFNKSTVVIQ
jgi:hypothetical protein